MFVKAEFNEKGNADRYTAHLADLTKWRNGNPKVIDNICKKLFNRAQSVPLLLSIPVAFRSDQLVQL